MQNNLLESLFSE